MDILRADNNVILSTVDKRVTPTCGHDGELTYSSNLDRFMYDDCWDDYGEACRNGLA